jgi:hypothetical protein
MRKLFYLFILFPVFSYSQQFRFWVAFEDSTTAKDTIWLVWDSTATYGIDYTFGEQPMSMPTDTFQAYVFLTNNDSSKVFSAPTTSTTFTTLVYFNHGKSPVTITWDSSLVANNTLGFGLACRGMDNNRIWDYLSFYNFLDLKNSNSYTVPYYEYNNSDYSPTGFYFSKFPCDPHHSPTQ